MADGIGDCRRPPERAAEMAKLDKGSSIRAGVSHQRVDESLVELTKYQAAAVDLQGSGPVVVDGAKLGQRQGAKRVEKDRPGLADRSQEGLGLGRRPLMRDPDVTAVPTA
jgi:hypothetical protein